MKSVFWNARERRLRAGWRLLLQAALAVALAVLPIVLIAEPLTIAHKAGAFLPLLNKVAYDRVVNIIIGPLLTAMLVLSVWLAARYLDRRPSLADFGVRFDAQWWRLLAAGFFLGALLMTLVFAVERTSHSLVVVGMWRSVVPLSLAFGFTITKVICVGIYEELITRGYQLTNLRESIGAPAAVIVTSAIFALLHLTTEHSSALSVIGLFVNGILFAVAALETGRLSFPIGLHIAWNLFEGSVFGFPVSGDKEGASVLAIQQLGLPLVTGGDYGPEGGLIGIAASLAGIALIRLFRRRSRVRRQIA